MNNELNKKLAEWAGFRFSHTAMGRNFFTGADTSPTDFWVYPNKDCSNLPDFTQSLDACFKWLVPKLDAWLQGWGGLRTIGFVYDEYGIACLITTSHYVTIRNEGWVKTEALALCLAIEKLIDEENKWGR